LDQFLDLNALDDYANEFSMIAGTAQISQQCLLTGTSGTNDHISHKVSTSGFAKSSVS
jgi:hypothetical protein